MSLQTEQINHSQMISSHGPADAQEYTSVWMAKKTNFQKEKDIALLQNRILLLRKEEEKTSKKINETQNKANNILQNKKRNEENHKKKQNNQKNDEDFLKLMQKKSCGLRQAQKDERAAIRLALLDLKKEEAQEIKRISKQNSDAIKQTHSMHQLEKKKKHDAVQNLLSNSKMNVQTYWHERLRFFENQNELTKNDISRSQSQKEFMLSKLEQEEMELIKRLQYSQDVHQNVCQQLDKIIQMPASEYEEKFGPVIPPEKKKVHKKNTQSQGTFGRSMFGAHKKKQYQPIKRKGNSQTQRVGSQAQIQEQEQQQQQQQQQQQDQGQEEQVQGQPQEEEQQQEQQPTQDVDNQE